MVSEKVLCRVFEILELGKPDMSNFENRLKYQKIIYLLQSYGLSLGYGFNWYLKGPYSSSLAHELFSISSDSKIYKESKNLKFKQNELIVGKLKDFKEKLGDSKNDVLYLEVLASLHYINMASFSGKGTIEELKARLILIKPYLESKDNFDQIIRKAYKDLKNYN